MQFKICLRQIQLSDIGPECPYFPEDGEYDEHFDSFVHDLGLIDGVASAEAPDNNQIHVNANLDQTAFKAALKPLLQYYFCKLRISELAEMRVDLIE